MNRNRIKVTICAALLGLATGVLNAYANQPSVNISQDPLFLTGANFPPRALLNVSNDNQLFFNAYPEFADLTGNGVPEGGYNHDFDYFGYFDSYKCYSYSTAGGRFVPASNTNDKRCSGSYWSGNFLNWLTMARIDTVRKILYGGFRSTDDEDLTVLERTYLPNDAHSWVRFYDGDDIADLTPFSYNPATTVLSTSELTVARPPAGERNNADHRRWFRVPSWSATDVEMGDQLEIRAQQDSDIWMRGVVRQLDLGASTPRINVQITSFEAPETLTEEIAGWSITNHSRRGISFCNTTASNTTRSQDVTDPPLLRPARGNYALWTANERWQCQWHEERNRTAPAKMHVGGLGFSNGNDISASGLWANSENPRRSAVGLGETNYRVRVEVCKAGLIGKEDCQQYPNGFYKPVGLLQQFGAGETAALLFGMMTGSYTKNLSGGVLRKNIGTFADEVDPETGQFAIPDSGESIVRSLNALRLFGYNHGTGVYEGAGDDCGVGVQKSQMQDGRCMNWGNPQAEIFAEALRYFAGLSPNPDFHVAGEDKLAGLRGATWQDPVDQIEWCAPLTIVQFNASVNSFDNNLTSAVSGLPGLTNPDVFTNLVGQGEGIAGSEVFVGGDNRLCTSETLGSLSEFRGICPEAPNQDGTYGIAGLAHYAWTNDLRPDDRQGRQFIKTFGVSLAPAVPRIEVPRPGETEPSVVILPACENQGDGGLRCALADFQIIEQDIDAGTGAFFIQWDVHEWGSDFDMDINGTLSYEIIGNEITITTDAWSDSSGRLTGFGYIISGTSQDGFHAHSGINGYTNTNPVTGGPSCSNCRVTDAPTSHTFTIGGGVAELLREPLFYAAKWGGFDKSLNFPNDPRSWDQTGDGLPDNYVFAANPAALRDALKRTFQEILALAGGSSIATESSRVREGSFLYRAEFDSDDWSGNVSALDPFTLQEQWNAVDRLPANRSVFTFGTDSGIRFNREMNDSGVWGRLGASISQLALERFGWDDPDGPTQERLGDLVDYLIGDTSKHNDPFRPRPSPIGDIINSRLRYSGPNNEGWARLSVDEGGGVGDQSNHTYGRYVDCAKRDPRVFDSQVTGCTPSRYSTVFVGSNSGMLHAFDAEEGEELFAFVPRSVQSNLWELADPNYESSHRFFVDGQVEIADAFDGTRWRTILVGGLGAGGRAIYALDVSQPQNFGTNDVLWEVTHEDSGFEDLGHVYGRPRIARLESNNGDGRWVAIFGNGYGSREERGFLYVVDLFTGQRLDRITVPETTVGQGANAKRLAGGLSGPAVVTNNFGTAVDRLYAGDLAGNVWRFTVNNGSIQAPSRLFTDPDNNPITVTPTVARNTRGRVNVFFGTGKLFEVGDNVVSPTNEPTQTYYGLVDSGSSLAIGDLGKRELTIEQGGRTIVGDQSAAGGWYLDLIVNGEKLGERVVQPASISFGRLLFRSYEPSDDPCLGGGIIRDYPLDALSGTLVGGLAIVERPGAPSGGSEFVIWDPPVSPPGNGGSQPPFSPPQPIFGGDEHDIGTPDSDEDMTGARDAWCSEFGFIDLDGNFTRMGTVCDGRQSWRQIR